jgi:hypothetical protein
MPGPHLAAAIFCERVIEDKDGVLTAIRMVDRITVTATGPAPPPEMPPTVIDLTALISLKSGDARGRYTIRLRGEAPSGQPLPTADNPVHYEGDERGANLVIRMALQVDLEGLYWFDVLHVDHDNERLLTRMPLRLIYQPQRTSLVM